MSENLPYTFVYRPSDKSMMSCITILEIDGRAIFPAGYIPIGTVYTTREALNIALDFSAETHGCEFCSYVPKIGTETDGNVYFFESTVGMLRCFFGPSYRQILSIVRIAMAFLNGEDSEKAWFLFEKC